jgi:hypothetical protein
MMPNQIGMKTGKLGWGVVPLSPTIDVGRLRGHHDPTCNTPVLLQNRESAFLFLRFVPVFAGDGTFFAG